MIMGGSGTINRAVLSELDFLVSFYTLKRASTVDVLYCFPPPCRVEAISDDRSIDHSRSRLSGNFDGFGHSSPAARNLVWLARLGKRQLFQSWAQNIQILRILALFPASLPVLVHTCAHNTPPTHTYITYIYMVHIHIGRRAPQQLIALVRAAR